MTDRAKLASEGFGGFVSVRDLRDAALEQVPTVPGVYVVLRERAEAPSFLAHGTGGFFKGKDPNVPVETLAAAWVSETTIVYIGKAGGRESAATLRGRLRAYLRFGAREPVAHWGGRYIWQLADAEDLTVCWWVTSGGPRDVEKDMLRDFEGRHGRLPFANLQR